MQRVGIFVPRSDDLFWALMDGLHALKIQGTEQNSGIWAGGGDVDSTFAAIIVGGRAAKSRSMAAAYAGRGVEAIVTGPPLLAADQVRIGRPDHAWLPDEVSGARFDALGIECKRIGKKEARGAVYLIPQQGNTRGIGDQDARDWIEDAATQISDQHGAEVVSTGPMDGCGRAVTYNHDAGLLALIDGMSVVTGGPCFYDSLTGSLKHWAKVKTPSVARVQALCARVAHTQWSLEEIASGEAFGSLGMDLFGE